MQVFQELPSLGFIKSASLIGHNNNQEMRACQMQDTIAKFRDGRVCSLLFNLNFNFVEIHKFSWLAFGETF